MKSLQSEHRLIIAQRGMLTVSSNQSFDAFASALAESVHHEEQQREDEEGGDAADDQSHPAGHRVKQTVSI